MSRNFLAEQASPYLLQHKDNPVWWHPWGEQAFAEAQRRDLPIFLSVGYSTCHWCHVMEHDSFEREDVGQILNQNFIAIKVDREERPDVDDIYMKAVQNLTGHGGWPLSAWLTPDGRPFYGGTYFPRTQFMGLLEAIARIWREERPKILQDAETLSKILLAPADRPSGDASVRETLLNQFIPEMIAEFDPLHGGFGGAPKFPPAMILQTMMRIDARADSEAAKPVVTKTLDKMAEGGIYDHLHGGFHRYSVDEQWTVPHFEKMLYDNALMAETYLDAYRLYGREEYALIAREVLDYILREMRHPEGGFFSAQDADSLDPAKNHAEEGFFCTFRREDFQQALSSDEYQSLIRYFKIDAEPNFEGRFILTQRAGRSRQEKHEGVLRSALEKLRQIRGSRPQPHLDDKVLLSWNAWAISALSKASITLAEPRYQLAAEEAYSFLEKNLRDQQGQWFRRWRRGQAGVVAFGEDIAGLLVASLDLYELTGKAHYYQCATKLCTHLRQKFWDGSRQRFALEDGSDKKLPARVFDDYEGVHPTTNAMAAWGLLRLSQLNHAADLKAEALQLIDPILEKMRRYPQGFAHSLGALCFALSDVKQIVIKGQDDETQLFRHKFGKSYLPFTQLISASEEDPAPPAAKGHGKDPQNRFFICRLGSCLKPTSSAEAALEQLQVD